MHALLSKTKTWAISALLFTGTMLQAQTKTAFIDNIVKEEQENSHLEKLAHELTDQIGPRLVGTPQLKAAHDWAVAKAGALKPVTKNGVNGGAGNGASRIWI